MLCSCYPQSSLCSRRVVCVCVCWCKRQSLETEEDPQVCLSHQILWLPAQSPQPLKWSINRAVNSLEWCVWVCVCVCVQETCVGLQVIPPSLQLTLLSFRAREGSVDCHRALLSHCFPPPSTHIASLAPPAVPLFLPSPSHLQYSLLSPPLSPLPLSFSPLTFSLTLFSPSSLLTLNVHPHLQHIVCRVFHSVSRKQVKGWS